MEQANTNATLEHFSSTADSRLIGDALLEKGAVIVTDVLNQATLKELNADIDTAFATEGSERKYMNETLSHFYGPQTRHVAGLAGKSAVFRRDILCADLFIAMCERVLRPNCATYQL